MIELKKDNNSLWVRYRNRYEYIIFLVPIIGILICILLSMFSHRTRIVLNHSVIYILAVFGGGSLIYIMLLFDADSNFLLMSLFLICIIFLWILVPMLLTYSLIYYTDSSNLLKLFDDGYTSVYITREDIKEKNI